jgi:hypothetical protein
MPPVKDVDAMADFGLTLDHFYGIVKGQIGNLDTDQYVQLQATATTFDVSTSYPWFSYGNVNRFFDVRLDPKPVAENVTLMSNARLSSEYTLFMADLLSLVEYRELDGPTLKRIDQLTTRIANNGSRVNALLQRRMDDWLVYAAGSMVERGDLVAFTHWAQGHHTTREINELIDQQSRDQALISALRLRRYTDPSHQAVVDAYAAATGPAARMRYPRYEDKEYGEEAKKFNVIYFASLADNESSLFANRQLMTPGASLETIAAGALGAFSSTVSKGSSANSSITTDWSAKGSGGFGPFRFSANVSSHQRIKEDFSRTQSITVGAKSLQAVPIDATSWFDPSMFTHPLVMANRRLFERYLGPKGSLLYYPSQLIFARGFNLKFTSSQSWQYDYRSDFSASGSAKAKIFGVRWGGGGKYSESKHEQKVETRGHDLVLDDQNNLRLLGYVATKNTAFEEDLVRSLEKRFAGSFMMDHGAADPAAERKAERRVPEPAE